MEKEIGDYFRDVKDPRVVGRCDHLLSDILVIAVCTYLSGGTDYQDMYLFGKERGTQLKGIILRLPNSHPSADTYESVFKNLGSSCLKECLEKYGKDILGCLAEKQVVLDGKKLKGSSPTSKGNSGLYILNAWVSENCICVGQQKVEDKSNENTAIPQILNSLEIEDAVVSIDAMGTQTAIAKMIREKKGHYLPSVKCNQKELFEDIECAFKTHHGYHQAEDTDCGHGRIETRTCSILPAKDFLLEENLRNWKDLATLVKIEAKREIKGGITKETRYYISDEVVSNAAYYGSQARGHWSIENNLHWHLDVTFKEYQCRARMGYSPENLSTVRKFALQIITNAGDKLSLKKRQFKAALNLDYLKFLFKI